MIYGFEGQRAWLIPLAVWLQLTAEGAEGAEEKVKNISITNTSIL